MLPQQLKEWEGKYKAVVAERDALRHEKEVAEQRLADVGGGAPGKYCKQPDQRLLRSS